MYEDGGGPSGLYPLVLPCTGGWVGPLAVEALTHVVELIETVAGFVPLSPRCLSRQSSDALSWPDVAGFDRVSGCCLYSGRPVALLLGAAATLVVLPLALVL